MSSVREHHQLHYTKMAKLHRAAAAAHESAAEDHEEGSPHHTMHKLEADHHEAVASHYDEMHDDCQKAMGDDLSKLIPDQVRAVVPAAPVPYGSALGLTAVPRAGQPPMNTERPNVPLEFQHLVKVD
jgi:hypothetical protein